MSRHVGTLVFALMCTINAAHAEMGRVAVAANFAVTASELATQFARQSPHRVTMIAGSTGKLFAQIHSGAPFDALLAADQEYPQRLIDDGLAVQGSERTYARGRLVLWSRGGAGQTDAAESVLRGARFRYLAVANPQLAPYGKAAIQVLATLEMTDMLRDRLVYGENVAQALALVDTGNADLGMVALAQVLHLDHGRYWTLPETWYAPIRQDAVLLQRGQANAAARAFLEFLLSPSIQAMLERDGYLPAS